MSIEKAFEMIKEDWEKIKLKGIVYGTEGNEKLLTSLALRKRALRKKIADPTITNSERKALIEEEVELNKQTDGER